MTAHTSRSHVAQAPAYTPPPPRNGWKLGRIGRLGFLFGILYATSVFFVCAGLILVVSLVTGISPYADSAGMVLYNNITTAFTAIARVLFAVAVVTLAIRRLHDVEFSAWVLLLMLIPLVNLALIGCLLLARSKEPNKYGPPLQSMNFWKVLGLK